jgi:GTPase-associated protein 1, N-terminal domain type 2
MKIRHHLYTFLPDKKERRGGAQTVYASPSLSPEALARLERHSIYERPDWLGPDDAFEKYPVSYGYFLLDEAHGVLARVVYRGRHGIRAGNFLAHHVIFPLSSWEEGSPLYYLEDPVLFRGDYQEDEATPRDADLPSLPEREPSPEALQAALGASLETLLACVIAGLLQQGHGPRVAAALPQEFFSPDPLGLRLVLSLTQLLPHSLRPAFTFRTYQLDPTEPKARLVLVPASSTSQLKSIKGDAQFLLFDPQNTPPNLPAAATEYAQLAVTLFQERDVERLVLLQEGFTALFAEGLSAVVSPRTTLTLFLQAIEAASEAELIKLMAALAALDAPSVKLVGGALFERFGGAYLAALTSGKLSAIGLQLLRLAPEPNAVGLIAALQGFAHAAREAPQRAPWVDFFALFALLSEATQQTLLEALAPRANDVCVALSTEQLLSLSIAQTSPSSLRLGALTQLQVRDDLQGQWPRLEPRMRELIAPKDAQPLFSLLFQAGLHSAAAELFNKKILPHADTLLTLLPAALEAMQRSRLEDGEVGRRLLTQAQDDTRKEILLYALQNNLMTAWRVSISEQPIALLAAVEMLADLKTRPGLFAEELARIGLWRQVLRLRMLSSKDPFLEAIEPAMLAAKTANALESIIDTALERSSEMTARKLLLLLVGRAQEAQLMPRFESLAERVYAKQPEARRYAIVPAALLERRSTRFWGARVLHNELNRLPASYRRELLTACLERLTIVDGSESDLAMALRSAFHDATDERMRWLSEEARRVGLLVVAQTAANELAGK